MEVRQTCMRGETKGNYNKTAGQEAKTRRGEYKYEEEYGREQYRAGHTVAASDGSNTPVHQVHWPIHAGAADGQTQTQTYADAESLTTIVYAHAAAVMQVPLEPDRAALACPSWWGTVDYMYF